MIKNILLVFVSIIAFINLNAQLKLIPTPQNIEIHNSEFEINNNTLIINKKTDTFYSNQLINSVNSILNIQLKQSRKAKSNFIEFIKPSSSKELKKLMSKNGLNPDFDFNKEGYSIKITKKSIKIISPSDAGIFYGVQTLKQIIKANSTKNCIPCLTIYDKPDIAIRAWQDDVSRGPIPTMEVLKEQIRKMSSYKLNYFSLYIEHVYQFEKHPDIAPKDGFTKAQILELTKYAKKHHITLIGNYQSFGHMEETLIHPKYKHLAENDHVICPALEESYDFLNDVYEEIVPVFSGDFFNINCDETFGLGSGRSKTMVDTMGIDGVYVYHINRLNNMLKKYDKKILMWGDIVTKYPNTVELLPKDMTVMAWGYHIAENFDYAITPISSKGLDFWVAPGVSCWGNIFPNFNTAEINIYNFIRDGKKNNTSGVLNTTWDDDGLNFFHNNWHGLIWGAEICWKTPDYKITTDASDTKRKERYKKFNQAFDPLFYGLQDESLISSIIAFSDLHHSGVRNLLKNNRFFEPIFPIHLEYVSEARKMKNLEVLKQLDSLETVIDRSTENIIDNKITIEYIKFAIKQVEFTLHKNIFRINLYHFIKEDNTVEASEIKSQIKELSEKAKRLKEEYRVLWNKENRASWLEVNMKKFDALIDEIYNLHGHCIISPSIKTTNQQREITIRSLFNDLPIYYSLNNDTVGNTSIKYSNPFFINDDVNIKARVINIDTVYKLSECKLIHHKAIGKLHKLNSKYSEYHPSYDAGGKYALLDGKTGNAQNLRSGLWQGYSGQNIEIEIDLEQIQPIKYFSMGFYQNTHSWVIFPKKVEIMVKNNASDEYQLIKTITNTISPKTEGHLKHNFTTTFDNSEFRFVKIIAYYYGKLPEWHHAGPENESMIFSDEIILK